MASKYQALYTFHCCAVKQHKQGNSDLCMEGQHWLIMSLQQYIHRDPLFP